MADPTYLLGDEVLGLDGFGPDARRMEAQDLGLPGPDRLSGAGELADFGPGDVVVESLESSLRLEMVRCWVELAEQLLAEDRRTDLAVGITGVKCSIEGGRAGVRSAARRPGS